MSESLVFLSVSLIHSLFAHFFANNEQLAQKTDEQIPNHEYLGEIETEFKNTLACLSGAQMGSNREQELGGKSRDTLLIISSTICT